MSDAKVGNTPLFKIKMFPYFYLKKRLSNIFSNAAQYHLINNKFQMYFPQI